MFGLRFFACVRCDTVYALPADETRCERCGDARLEEITDRLWDDSYFVPPADRSD